MIVVAAVPPLTPDPDTAREWAERELADGRYAESEPTFFDRAAQWFADVIDALFGGGPAGAFGPVLAIIVVAVIVGLIVVAIAIWGRPRAIARSRRAGAELFGADDPRSAAELRSAAEQAAHGGDFSAAVILRTRAVARALVERTILELEPGATVHRFARAASQAFPSHGAELARVADVFDGVRYLDRPGSAADYDAVTRLDLTLASAPSPVTVTAP